MRRIGHTCEHMRDHAQSLNPPARGCLTRPTANFPLRQRCAEVRGPTTGPATPLLTATLGYGRSRARLYNTERPHSALGGRTPAEAYRVVGFGEGK